MCIIYYLFYLKTQSHRKKLKIEQAEYMLKTILFRCFILCYSFFYWFCCYRGIHSLDNFPLFVRVCVSILSLLTERDKSKNISLLTRAISKWTTLHKILRQAHFYHTNSFFLEDFLDSKNPKSPWMVYTTVSTNTYKLASLV